MNRKYLFINRIQKLMHPMVPVPVNIRPRLHRLENIRCVAFDFYGTMFISAVGDIGIEEEQEEKNAGRFLKALKNSGFSIQKSGAPLKGIQLFDKIINKHKQRAKSKGIDYPEPVISAVWLEVLTKLKRKRFIKGELSEEAAMLFGIEFEFRVNDVWPVEGLSEVLGNLKNREFTLGIISNSQFYTPLTFEAALEQSPEEFGFNPELLIWSYETGRKKPSSDFYRLFTEAAERKNIAPEEVLYVGNDIRKDIRPAKEAGMKTALYAGDFRSVRHEDHELDLPEFSADIIIDDLKQLLECLQ